MDLYTRLKALRAHRNGHDLRRSRKYVDLAPMIFRQRLVVEGTPSQPISDRQIVDYLRLLGPALRMQVLTDPVTHRSEKYGEAGWVHWETSGTHLYAWESPLLFISVDIYTCAAFDPWAAVDFTGKSLDLTRVTWKEW